MPSFKDWLLGKGDKVKKRTLLTKEQEGLMSLIDEGLTKGTGPLADLFGEFNAEEFEKGVSEPMMKAFKEKILPLISEKYISNNQVGTSAMRKGEMEAGTDFQSQLAQLMYKAQQDQKQNRLKGLGLQQGTTAFENEYQKGYPGALAEFGTEVVKGLGKRIGSGNLFGGGDAGAGQGSAGGGFNPNMAANAAMMVGG